MSIKESKRVVYTTSDGTEFRNKVDAEAHEYGNELAEKLPRAKNGQVAVSKMLNVLIENADFFIKHLSKVTGKTTAKKTAKPAPKVDKPFTTVEVRDALVALRDSNSRPPQNMEAYLLEKRYIQGSNKIGKEYELSRYGVGMLNLTSTWKPSKSKIHESAH